MPAASQMMQALHKILSRLPPVQKLQEANQALQAELRSQLSTVQQLQDERQALQTEVEALRSQRGQMIADTFAGHSELWDERFPSPEAYQEMIRALAKRVEDRPDDVQAHLDLADAYLLVPAGGPGLFERAMPLVETAFDPQKGLEVLHAAQEIAPGDARVAAKLRSARRLAISPLLIAALPKSGSEFLFAMLRKGLGKQWIRGAETGYPDSDMIEFGLLRLVAARGICKGHIRATPINLFMIFKRFALERMTVHVRDPRQAMVSFAHFMPAVLADPVQAMRLQIDPDYSEWSWERQIDWQIENWLPSAVEWIAKWIEAEELPWIKGRILFTTFEDMVRDQDAFFQRLVAFHGIDADLFDAAAQPQPKRHGELNFRRGLIDEWRTALTPAQIERASALIPPAMGQRFGWPQ